MVFFAEMIRYIAKGKGKVENSFEKIVTSFMSLSHIPLGERINIRFHWVTIFKHLGDSSSIDYFDYFSSKKEVSRSR